MLIVNPMHPLLIISMAFLFSGLIVGTVAGILYNPAIQLYIEKFGVAPSFFLFNGSGLRDYLNAKKVAKRWGHKPEFMRRYERLSIIGLCLIAQGLVLLLVVALMGLK